MRLTRCQLANIRPARRQHLVMMMVMMVTVMAMVVVMGSGIPRGVSRMPARRSNRMPPHASGLAARGVTRPPLSVVTRNTRHGRGRACVAAHGKAAGDCWQCCLLVAEGCRCLLDGFLWVVGFFYCQWDRRGE